MIDSLNTHIEYINKHLAALGEQQKELNNALIDHMEKEHEIIQKLDTRISATETNAIVHRTEIRSYIGGATGVLAAIVVLAQLFL